MKTSTAPTILAALSLFCCATLLHADTTWRPKERWRGFNLLGMFYNSGKPPQFEEWKFREIHELGFNFVRLPMDYRFWIVNQDWEKIDEARIRKIDEAVRWGQKYRLHVMLCFHRAPGYTVAKPAEKKDLFTDPDAQRVCAKHWAFFAKRYRGIPNDALSFNLFNEPANVSDAAYTRVASKLIQAIHQEDPNRFIVADGLNYCQKPTQGLFPQKGLVGQAMRGYAPMSISHYLASWVGFPSAKPSWPPVGAISPLYGEGKGDWNRPLLMENLPAATWEIQFGKISDRARIQLTLDGKPIVNQMLRPKIGPGWTNTIYQAQWKIFQGDKIDPIRIPALPAAKQASLRIGEGDWAEISHITLIAENGDRAELAFMSSWGGKNDKPFRFQGWGKNPNFLQAGAGDHPGQDYLNKTVLIPWKPAREAGVFTMVGEFGAYNKTPHPIVLSWLEDQLKLWAQHNLGWAMWNFQGSFGILDSGRTDVQYEEYKGHKLDRKMLNLLLKY